MELIDVSTFLLDHWVELTGTLISILWVYLEYKASIWLWPVGIILPLFFIVISWRAHLYGSVVVNVYYLVTSIYGWIVWIRHREEDGGEMPIRNIPPKALIYTLLISIPLWGVISWALGRWTDSPYPWADGLATLTSFIGMIWLSRKWREVWFCWILANAINLVLFFLVRDYISIFAFLVNLIFSFLGYFSWRPEEKQVKTTN